MHPAWLPLTSRFELGDFGVWRGGVFTPLGNVRDFGAAPEIVDGEPVRLDFQSRGVVMVDAGAAAAATVKAVDAAVDLAIQCADAESFILQAPVLRSRRIANVAAVAAAVSRASGADGRPRWRSRYKFVTELFTGEQVTILATTEAKTTITLRGRASDPRELLKGGVDAALAADKSLGLSLVGAAGPVGLRLVRIGARGAAVSFDGAPVDDDPERAAPPVIAEEAWDDDPEDDPEDDASEAAG